MRSITISRSGSFDSFPAMPSSFLRGSLQRLQMGIEAVEALLPEPAELVEPVRDPFQPRGFQTAWPELGRAPARDDAGLLQHLEVLGDGGLAEIERLAQLRHRRLAPRQAGDNRAPGRVRERGERHGEWVSHYISTQLYNYI